MAAVLGGEHQPLCAYVCDLTQKLRSRDLPVCARQHAGNARNLRAGANFTSGNASTSPPHGRLHPMFSCMEPPSRHPANARHRAPACVCLVVDTLPRMQVIHCRWAMLGAAGCIAPEILGSVGATPAATNVVWFQSGVIPPAGTYEGYWADPYTLFFIEVVAMQFAELKRLQDFR